MCGKNQNGEITDLHRPPYLYKVIDDAIEPIDMDLRDTHLLFQRIFQEMISNEDVKDEKVFLYTQLIILNEYMDIKELSDILLEEDITFIKNYCLKSGEYIKRMS